MTVEIDKSKSNLQASCSKEDLMQYYSIESEEKWNKIMEKTKTNKNTRNVKAFRKKMIMGKETEGMHANKNVP